MRIHRAFAKPMERVPKWSNCCREAHDAHLSMIASGEMLLDMDAVHMESRRCNCGHTTPKSPCTTDIKDGCLVHLEDCDIDEVALTAEEVEALDVVRR